MVWNKSKSEDNSISIFDVEIPNMDFSLDSVFAELKTELKEETSRNGKKVRKRKVKRKPKKIAESVEVRRPLSTVEDIASKLDKLEKTHPTLIEKTDDPLALVNTPKYMTQSEFQNHYKLLLDRIQIQLSSLGGGGAVNIRDMDDVDTTFLTDPESMDGAVMRMQYVPDQKVLQFYGDNSFIFNNRSLIGTADQININLDGERFTVSMPDYVAIPGTLTSVGITTLATSGEETHTGGDMVVSGTAKATKFSTTSDERLKTNIERIEDPLEVLSHLEGVKFNWISDNSEDVGLIAQDVERCLPEAVEEKDGIKSVNYNGVVGLLVEAVKEISKENQLLRMEIESLK